MAKASSLGKEGWPRSRPPRCRPVFEISQTESQKKWKQYLSSQRVCRKAIDDAAVKEKDKEDDPAYGHPLLMWLWSTAPTEGETSTIVLHLSFYLLRQPEVPKGFAFEPLKRRKSLDL
jgi:hypothetical protein